MELSKQAEQWKMHLAEHMKDIHFAAYFKHVINATTLGIV